MSIREKLGRLLVGKNAALPAKHLFTDEERLKSTELRNLQTEIKTFKQKLEMERLRLEAERDMIRLKREIDDLKNENSDETDAGNNSSFVDKALLTLLTNVMQKNQNTTPTPSVANSSQRTIPMEATEGFYPDEQINEFVSSIPSPILAQAKKLNDEELTEEILERIPDANDDSIKRIIKAIHAR